MRLTRDEIGKPKIAIIDPCSAAGYDLPDIANGGLGGTEATVLRIATVLRHEFDVSHFQSGRSYRRLSAVGRLLALSDMKHEGGSACVIVINRWKLAVKLRKRYPEIPIFLWLHVYPGRHNRRMGAALKEAGITVVCVSRTHHDCLSEFLGEEHTPELRVIYNPVDDDLRPDKTPRDPNRLLFASSPHKGLAQVFDQFATLRASLPEMTLAVADPGYLQWDVGPMPEGVVFLGPLSHPALIRQMRRALCLFYPQSTFAETFGLVLAEANAVGTPVLVHRGLGANDEIVADPRQRVNGDDPREILQRIHTWRRSPPSVSGNPAFRLNEVARQWSELLLSAVRQKPCEVQR